MGNNIGVFDENGNDISNNLNHIGNLNSYRYRGYYYDRETNLYYLGYRYYSPTHHRFISTDCATYDDIVGGNLYVYCNNNPVIKVDDNGKFPLIGVAIVGGILNVGAYVVSNTINKKKLSLKEGIFHFATGAAGAALGEVNFLLGLTVTSLADNIYDTVSDRKKENASNKKNNKKQTEKEKRKNLREDIASVIIGTSVDVLVGSKMSKVAKSVIPNKGGRPAKRWDVKYTGKKAQNYYKRESFNSFLTTTVSIIEDKMIENDNNFQEANKIIDINSPLYQPQDNRFYIVDMER